MSRYFLLALVPLMIGCYARLDEAEGDYPATNPPPQCTIKVCNDYWSWINLQHCLDKNGKPVTLVVDPVTKICSWSMPQTCKMNADCDAAAGGAGKGVCDKSCGCCVTKCAAKPADGTTVCRYVTQACNADGSCPAPPVANQGDFGWFAQQCGLKCGTFSSTMCVWQDPNTPYCLYQTQTDAKNCSDACASGGFRKYECGGTNCDGQTVVGCSCPPANDKNFWTYKLVDNNCPKKKKAMKSVMMEGGSYCVACTQYEVDNGLCGPDCNPNCGDCGPTDVCVICAPGVCSG